MREQRSCSRPLRARAARAGCAALALTIAAALPIACGGERDFDAQTLVSELNDAGAGLTLGPPLDSGAASEAEVTVLGFSDAGEPGSGTSQGSGAIVILDDADQARSEFERCEAAVSFVCFRAANVVLRFAGMDTAQRGRVSAALTDLQTD